MKNAKPYLVGVGALAATILLFYLFGEFILPFILGLLGAYFADGHVRKLQRFIPNRNVAVTAYLFAILLVMAGSLFFFGAQLVRDVERLNDAFVSYASDHQDDIDNASERVRSYIDMIYSNEDVQQALDSVSLDSVGTEYLTDALSNITSFLGQSGGAEEEESRGPSINMFSVILYTLLYFLFILYTFGYFQEKFEKYFGSPEEVGGAAVEFIEAFQRIFLEYFKRRSWIVLICSAIFITTFLILSIPGAILLGLLAGILCYIAHFHYLALLPLALTCWVRSVESSESFFLYFGVVVGVFVLVSILEELVLYPRIMEEIDSINIAIFVLFSLIWADLFGGTMGTFITLPLTTVVLIYVDRLLLYWKAQREAIHLTESESEG